MVVYKIIKRTRPLRYLDAMTSFMPLNNDDLVNTAFLKGLEADLSIGLILG